MSGKRGKTIAVALTYVMGFIRYPHLHLLQGLLYSHRESLISEGIAFSIPFFLLLSPSTRESRRPSSCVLLSLTLSLSSLAFDRFSRSS